MLRLPPVLRPRLTWRYIIGSAALLYISYCFLYSSPLFASRLPQYTGLFSVGTVDIESPCDGHSTSAFRLEETGEYAFKLDTVLFTLYYPSQDGGSSSRPHHYWIPKPISLTAEGYTRFGRINNVITNNILTGALWTLVGGITIPANVDVPLYDSLGRLQPVIGINPKIHEADRFPVLVFSHGFASSRTDYTHYLGELASRGYVVAAIEHRDGSGPGSTVMKKDAVDRNVFPMRVDQMISDSKHDNADFKKAQLDFRQAEVEATVRILAGINEGKGNEIYLQNPRLEGRDLHAWTGRLAMNEMTMCGHSFGATLALQTLKGAPSTSRPFRGAIILDPGKSSGQLNHDIGVPLLVIHSNSWSRTHSMFFGRPHVDVVKELVYGVLKTGKGAWFMTSLGTSHPSVTDAPLIEPLLLSWTTGASIDVKEGVHQYVAASEEFLRYQRTAERTGLLSMPITHPEYGKEIETAPSKDDVFSKYRKFWEIHLAPE